MQDRHHLTLNVWVDHVWRPADIQGLKVDLAAGCAGRRVWEQYYVLPHPRRPRLLVPSSDLAVARRMIAAHARLATPRAQLLGAVARRTALAATALSRRLPTLTVSSETSQRPPLLITELSHLLDVDGRLQALFTLRPPTAHTKPVIGLFDRHGVLWAYAKVGISPGTAALVRCEATTLRALSGTLPSVITPRLLAETTWFDQPVSVIAPLPDGVARCDDPPDTMVDTLMEISRSGTFGVRPLTQSSYAVDVASRLADAVAMHGAHARLMSRWWDRLRLSDPTLAFGRGHGDWVSWNLGRLPGRVVAWDWERSRLEVPVGFDYLHWYFARKEMERGSLCAAEHVSTMRGGLVAFGVRAADTETVADLYLFDHCLAELTLSGDTDRPGLDADLHDVASRRVSRG